MQFFYEKIFRNNSKNGRTYGAWILAFILRISLQNNRGDVNYLYLYVF